MAGPNYFQITDGLLAFEAVDTAAVGYDADLEGAGWQDADRCDDGRLRRRRRHIGVVLSGTVSAC